MASREETRKVQIIMNGQKANASIKEMKASAALLWNQMSKLPTTSKEFIAKSQEFQKVSTRLRGVQNEARGVSKGMSFLSGTVGKLFGAFGAYTILNKVGQAWDFVTGKTRKFEKSLSTLQSITGATADDMAFYEVEAKKLGKTSTLSAGQVADAYTLIASKKPELLKNKEALNAVTKETISLAEAAGIDLVPAADALTGVLNQWGEPASEASRVINVLAAGSKYGAGNIEFLNDSMLRFGPAAKDAKISIEQSASAMELFAEKGIPSEKAGTSFRNILIELSKGADEYNPKVVGLSTALDNLAKDYDDSGKVAEKFGSQNAIAAQVLLENRKRVDEFTEALTGTNVAYEQQRINNNNWEGDMKALDSVTETLALNIGERMLPALRAVTQWWTNLLSVVSDWFEIPMADKLEKEQRQMNYLVEAIQDTNEESEDRVRLISRLQLEYPDFLGNLDAETVTNEQLRDRLSEVNQEYTKKILLARQDAELTELIERQMDLREKKDEMRIRKQELEAEKKAGFKDDTSLGTGGATKEAILGNLPGMMDEIQQEIDALDTKRDEVKEKWKRIAEEMGADLTEVAEGVVTTNETVVSSIDKVVTTTEDLGKKKLESSRRLEDLRLELIEDSYEREREKTIAKYNRDIEDLNENSETYLQEVIALEDTKRQALEDLRLQHEEEDRIRKEEKEMQKLEEMELEEEKRLLEVENAYLNAVTSEQELQEAVYNVQKEYAEKKIDQLTKMHGAESVEVARAKNELLKIEQAHAAEKEENERRYHMVKRQIQQEGLQASMDIFAAGAMLLKEGSKAQKIAMKAYKAFAIGSVVVDTQQQIQAIWKNMQSNPMNILFPGWGKAIAIIKTAAALGRAGISIQRIRAQQFAGGGPTIPMVNIGGVWQTAKHIGSFARGGNFSGNNLGVIGEKGPEWVAPNWMLRHPATANVIGMLEAKRQQGRAFADGGATRSQEIGVSSTAGTGNEEMAALLAANNKLLAQLVAMMGAWPTQLKVWASLTDLDDGLKMLQKLRDDASVG